MKFACPKCSTRYSIADEKVPPAKTLRFPCKKCGNVIRLQRKQAGSKTARDPATSAAPMPSQDTPADTTTPKAAAAAAATGVDADENAATRVASVKDIQRALAAGRDEPAPATPDAADEWYVLVGGKQQGPMGASRVADMFTQKVIDKRTYAWRDGMADWDRLGAIAELCELVERVGDAASRVSAPREDSANQATLAIDARQLEAQLRRTRDEHLTGLDNQDTHQKGFGAPTAEAARDQTERPTDISVPVDLRDPAVIDALAGEPITGERLTRPMSGEQSAELLAVANLGSENQSQKALAGITAPEPAPFTGSEEVTPEQGRPPVETGFEFDDPTTDELVDGFGGYQDSIGEPVTTDPLGPALSDVFGASQEFPAEGAPFGGYDTDAPPGASTRLFMATAGLYKRRRTHRIAAVVGIMATVLLITVLSLDILKIIELPGMGAIYARTGILDPNPDRGIRRVENELAKRDLSFERRAALEANRAKYERLLLSSSERPVDHASGPRRGADAGAGQRRPVIDREGVKDTHELAADERDTLKDVFADDRKSENAIRLADPEQIETPNLPEGLSKKAIFEVVKKSGRSIQLCSSESSRKGEQVAGKLEMRVTIAPDGAVTDVSILTDAFKRTNMGRCTIGRVKNWRFPKFNGEPIDVVIPYHVYPVL